MSIKISNLPAIVTPLLTDVLPIVQFGVTYKETAYQLFNLMLANIIANGTGNPNGAIPGIAYQFYYDTTNDVLYVCTVTGDGGTAVWKPVPNALYTLTNGQLLIGSTGVSPVAATLAAGVNIGISNGPGSITISTIGPASFGWSEITSASQAMNVNNGYIANNAGGVVFSLPVTSSVGDQISVIGKGASGWGITQGASQQIQVGSTATTLGVGGILNSTNRYDSIDLVCTTANTIWTSRGAPQGNLLFT